MKDLVGQAKLKKTWKASLPKETTSPKPKKPLGVTVEKCIQSGGRVVDSHKVGSIHVRSWATTNLAYNIKTNRGTYAVHITTSDGATHSFSNVSKEHLVGVEGFKEE